ncbi:MAG: hypothetical protein AAGH46_04765 [Bacteroidota bacterium]
MKYSIAILLLLVLGSAYAYSQDTLRIGESYHYSAEEVQKLRGKGFHGKYGQENILFDQNHIKVEYCYYHEAIRTCYGYHYRIINDSTLTIGDSLGNKSIETWTFKKLSNSHYAVYRMKDGFLESGEVDTLIPLRHIEPFVTTTLDKKDTLWQTNDFTCLNRTHGYYTADFNVSNVAGRIYDYLEIDTPPVQLNGDSLLSIEINGIHPCMSQPLTWLTAVTCVVTKEGKIVNIEQALGGISDNCSYTMMEINRSIATWGRVKPATLSGRPVNVRWFIKIDDLTQPLVHPAFADTDRNRMEFLKRRKRFTKKNICH